MLTASGSEAVAVEAMKRGAKDYLPKAGLDVPPAHARPQERVGTETPGGTGGCL